MEGGKLECPEKNPQQQTQPTYDTGTGNRTQATLVEGECSHHCAIPAPRGSRAYDDTTKCMAENSTNLPYEP